jgi:hypothetical protein
MLRNKIIVENLLKLAVSLGLKQKIGKNRIKIE